MIELAIVLLVKRYSESGGTTKGHGAEYENEAELRSERFKSPTRIRNRTDIIDGDISTPRQASNQTMATLTRRNAFSDAAERFQQSDKGRGPSNGIQNDNGSKCSRITINAIDITATFLFPTFYLVFNVIYWCSMK